MSGNFRLAARMEEAGLTQPELAEAVNTWLSSAGHRATVSDRTVRTWLSGKICWPHPPQRAALEAVFACPIDDLGFVRRVPDRRSAPSEDPVHRRAFLTATTGTALTAAMPATTATRYTIGAADAHRLREKLDSLSAQDQAGGGSASLERAADTVRYQATSMVNSGGSSQRVRGMLYAVAADAAAAAAWYAIDGGRTASAEQHIDRSMRLAALSNDAYAVLHAWNSHIQHALFTGHRIDALAASEYVTNLPATRRDRLCRSLGHARIGSAAALLGDRQRADRSFAYAHAALSDAKDVPRPRWLRFYDAADLNSLHGNAHRALGRPERAEACAHHALATVATKPEFKRDMALYTVHLAEAQLAQGDHEHAAATATSAASLASTVPNCARARNAVEQLTNTLAAAR